MKFVVNDRYAGEYEVKLHWETKRKIKKIAFWSIYAGAVTASVAYVIKDRLTNDETEEES